MYVYEYVYHVWLIWNTMHDFPWTGYRNQNMFTQGNLLPESWVIARGQPVKACNTWSAEWNWSLASYSCRNGLHVSLEHLNVYFGQKIFQAGNFGPLCTTLECQIVSMWCFQNILHCRIYYCTEHITLHTVTQLVVSIHSAYTLSYKRACSAWNHSC